MTTYFLRRFLLMIPTFIGITFLCFTVTRFVPGGPVEQAVLRFQQLQALTGEGGAGDAGGSSAADGGPQISEETMQKLRAIYGFDKPFYLAYLVWLGRVVQLDLGTSDTFARPVWDVIRDSLPVSLWFGLTGFILSYTICIPLGVWKAVKHGSAFDTGTSVLVFIAYSIPGWSAGILLLLLFGGGSFWAVFPLGGVTSAQIGPDSPLAGFLLEGARVEDIPDDERAKFPQLRPGQFINSRHPAFAAVPAGKRQRLTKGTADDLSWLGQMLDRVWHMILPVFCYVLGMFASKTVLMKNSLMENLGQDYVRTAFAKGLSERTVIFKHALRNSLIPIATGLGHMLSLILAGSYLIEKVFNIHGFGYLGYTALVARDYPVTLGILVIGSSLKLLGNIIADMLYCLIDPRIRFS